MYGVQMSNIVTCLAVPQHPVCWLTFLNAILASAKCNTQPLCTYHENQIHALRK